MVKNILVTGGGGFIGSFLVESQLRLGNHLRVVDLHTERLAHLSGYPNLEIISGDITDKGLVRQMVEDIDVVYHLASAHLDVNLPAKRYEEVNVEGTSYLLKAAWDAGVKRVVHCSSAGVMGDIGIVPADESTQCRPTNIYEKTKLAGEQAALDFSRRTGLPVVAIRPSWVYGPRCPRTEKLFRMIRKGRMVIFGNGRTFRHPIHVYDAVRGLELCAEIQTAPGEVYIIAGEKPVTINELVGKIAEVEGVTAPSIYLPIPLGEVIAFSLQSVFKLIGRHPPFSRRSLEFFLKNNAYDFSKARRELGFQPEIGLEDGLRHTFRSLEQRGVAVPALGV